jgi:hypothetical protein
MAQRRPVKWTKQNAQVPLTKHAGNTPWKLPAVAPRERVHVPGFDQICDGFPQRTYPRRRTKQAAQTTTFSSKTPNVTARTEQETALSSSFGTLQNSPHVMNGVEGRAFFASLPQQLPPQRMTLATLHTKLPAHIAQPRAMTTDAAPQNESMSPDKLPDPPAIPTLTWWFVIGFLCLAVLCIVKIYFVVFPLRRGFRDLVSRKSVCRKPAAAVLAMGKKEGDGREYENGYGSRHRA